MKYVISVTLHNKTFTHEESSLNAAMAVAQTFVESDMVVSIHRKKSEG